MNTWWLLTKELHTSESPLSLFVYVGGFGKLLPMQSRAVTVCLFSPVTIIFITLTLDDIFVPTASNR